MKPTVATRSDVFIPGDTRLFIDEDGRTTVWRPVATEASRMLAERAAAGDVESFARLLAAPLTFLGFLRHDGSVVDETGLSTGIRIEIGDVRMPENEVLRQIRKGSVTRIGGDA